MRKAREIIMYFMFLGFLYGWGTVAGSAFTPTAKPNRCMAAVDFALNVKPEATMTQVRGEQVPRFIDELKGMGNVLSREDVSYLVVITLPGSDRALVLLGAETFVCDPVVVPAAVADRLIGAPA